jgi:uncharacterized protein (TIGR03000 family)
MISVRLQPPRAWGLVEIHPLHYISGGSTMYRRIVGLRVLTVLAVLAACASGQPTSYGGVDGRGHRGGGTSASSRRQVNYRPAQYYWAPLPAAYAPRQGYEALYPPPNRRGVENGGRTGPGNQAVTVKVSVPADAEIWFDGNKTRQTGPDRSFVSPPITPGRDYSYEVKTRWLDNGTEVIQTRRVTVHAGDVINLRFAAGPPQSASGR